jgi:glycosyltransferase involved in cell wall biosynthesis
VVTCTDANRQYLESLDAPRTQVVYHGVDGSRFHPRRRRPEAGRILSVGRLVPKKGFECLVEALAILADEGVDFTCDIVGGGPLDAVLRRRIQDHSIRDRVHVHGARVQDEIVEAYERASVFVLAPVMTEDGDRDGIPNVLAEAMACGVPVVSTRLSGIPELVEHGTDGLLVAPGDATALAAAIGVLLSDDSLASSLAEAGRTKVERLFDLRRNTRQLADLFASMPTAAPDSQLAPVR